MATLTIDLLIEHVAAQRAAAEVAASLRGVVAVAGRIGDAHEAAEQKGVRSFTRLRDAQGRFVAAAVQMGGAQKNVAEGFSLTEAAAKGFHGVMGSVAAQFGFMELAQQGVAMIARSFHDMRQNVVDATKAIGVQREELAQLAALKGLLGMSTEAMRQDLAFRAQTLQTAPDARMFQESALGAGASGIDRVDPLTKKVTKEGFISQAEFDKLSVLTGKFQATQGGDASTLGKLTGMIPILMGRRVTADEAFAKEKQLFDIADIGNASISSMTNMMLKNAPLITSKIFDDAADQMALTSAFSTSAGEGAAERVMQFTRATVGSLGRMRGMAGMDKIEGAEKQAEYLKRIGAESGMDPIAIGKLISADIEAQRAKQGEKFDPLLYLQSRGYGNQEDAMALLGFSGMYQSGQYKAFEDMSKRMPDGAKLARELDADAAADPKLRNRKTEITGAIADAMLGTGANEYYQTLMKSTFEQMRGKGEVGGKFEDIQNPEWYDLLSQSRQASVYERARFMLDKEARRVGMTDREIMDAGRGRTDEERLYNMGNAIGRHGGDPVPGLAKMAEAGDRWLAASAKEEDRIRAAHMEPAPPLPVGPAAAEPARK